MPRDDSTKSSVEEFFGLKECEVHLYEEYRENILKHKTALENDVPGDIQDSLKSLADTTEEIKVIEEKTFQLMDGISTKYNLQNFTLEDVIEKQPLPARKKYFDTLEKLKTVVRECAALTEGNKKMLGRAIKKSEEDLDALNKTRALIRKYNPHASNPPYSFYIDKKK